MSPTHAKLHAKDFDIDVAALTGVTADSRAVEKGFLFAALKGERVDGRDFIDDAIKRGASVILSDESVKFTKGAQFVTTDMPRRLFANVVSEFYGVQPKTIVAVTGTNGKSSVVHFVDQLWRALGKNSTYIGTLSGNMTTPDPVSLHALLSDMSKDGLDHVAMEASSHGLEQCRMDGVDIKVAAFTSFSQDHLDYHTDMESYLAAKKRLFSDLLPVDGAAVLNADSTAFDELSSVCKRRGIRVISYGAKGSDITLLSRVAKGAHQNIEVEVFGKYHALKIPLVGHFQVMNVLCALACVLSESNDYLEELLSVLEVVDGVPGRLQHVQSDDGSLNTYVDYAHTPDALDNVLEALRPHTEGRLICVFGCGGDRDVTKRPLMGEVAARLSNIAIVTDDNPRSEEAADIRASVVSGAQEGARASGAKILDIAGRREAIRQAVAMMDENDVLLIAGKGHEQGQIFNGFTEPFDDVCEVERAMREAVN